MRGFFRLLFPLAFLFAGCDLSRRDVAPAPIVEPVATGLRVLIVEETAERTKLPPKQLAIFAHPRVNAWLREHCKNGWLKCDRNDLVGEWREIADVAKPASMPWLIVCDGKRIIHNKPLPESVDAFMAVVQKFEEPK